MQRFASYEDLEKQHVTVEEREEYEQHLKKGTIVYAGVDYEAILREVTLLLGTQCFPTQNFTTCPLKRAQREHCCGCRL